MRRKRMTVFCLDGPWQGRSVTVEVDALQGVFRVAVPQTIHYEPDPSPSSADMETVTYTVLYGGYATVHPNAPSGQADQQPHDTAPEACWRCDARQSASDVGLCEPCHTYLVGDTEVSG